MPRLHRGITDLHSWPTREAWPMAREGIRVKRQVRIAPRVNTSSLKAEQQANDRRGHARVVQIPTDEVRRLVTQAEVCRQRRERREVLFAAGIGGVRRSAPGPYRRTWKSTISCAR